MHKIAEIGQKIQNFRKKSENFGASCHFWSIFDVAPGPVAENQVPGAGKETGFMARILKGARVKF